ncbi:MAG: S8 family serine peptidase, partial [Burkholderiales bacterium]|nr:S8 family serine peptidase [Burkholderiales bacterium]
TPASGQWYLRAPDTTIVSAINAVGAWNITTGSADVTVAVLDTGVRLDHPDLAGKLWPGYDFIHDVPTANDGDGRDADASDPGDWLVRNECGSGDPASAENSSWHGTQVAGLIGASTNNGIGMASVGYKTMLLPVRVLGKCGGFDSDILAGMRWAAGLSSDPIVNAHPANVLNMSLGSDGSCSASYRDAIAELSAAGVVVVAAAGNDTGHAVGEPANCAGAIGVAGLRHTGTKVGYSNIGPEVTLAAPAGNCVNLSGACLYPLLTTVNAGSTTPSSNTYSDAFNSSLGTSFATPLVAGTVALMRAVSPTLTPAAIKAALQASARPFPQTGAEASVVACRAPDGTDQVECYCTSSTCGAGMLDAAAAVARVQPSVAAPTVDIAVSSASVSAGTSVTLSAANATANGGRAIVSYQWAISSGGTLAAFASPTNTSAVTLATSAAGSVTVTLVVFDSAGSTGAASKTVTVTAASTGAGSSDKGGGALPGIGWALGLSLAIAALALNRRR